MRWVLWLLLACTVAAPAAWAQADSPAARGSDPLLTPPPPPPPEPERQGKDVPAPRTGPRRGTDARAGTAPSAPDARTGKPPSAVDVGVRLAAEILLGGVGEVGGAYLGFWLGSAVGSGGGSNGIVIGGLFGTGIGAAAGAMTGVLVGGLATGGTGTVASTALGAFGGMLLGVLTFPLLINLGPLYYLSLALPLVGAVLGYEISAAPLPGSDVASTGAGILPVVRLWPDGSGLVGIAGRF
ncbi:MAG TPA: hypothetical protein VK447_07720 [Myxococcaceae bacterium]|nr:hypothetical protein [Myxococcaceae bacterium]